MRLYAITDRKCFVQGSEPENASEQRLRAQIADWIAGGVEFIQLREKELGAHAMSRLAERVLGGLDRRNSKILINSAASLEDLAQAAGVADGVHVPGRPRRGVAEFVRKAFRAAGRNGIVSLSCHSIEDVQRAREEAADLAVFAPIFEKPSPSGESSAAVQGLEMLRCACETAREMPLFALGGVTVSNAPACVAAGAAGVAGIRLFAGVGWRSLRASEEGLRPIYS
jgi:thiamine-phosphate pyrophosphorylase